MPRELAYGAKEKLEEEERCLREAEDKLTKAEICFDRGVELIRAAWKLYQDEVGCSDEIVKFTDETMCEDTDCLINEKAKIGNRIEEILEMLPSEEY